MVSFQAMGDRGPQLDHVRRLDQLPAADLASAGSKGANPGKLGLGRPGPSWPSLLRLGFFFSPAGCRCVVGRKRLHISERCEGQR